MNRLKIFLLPLLMLTASAANAQDDAALSRLFVGIGSADVLDTYLSPYCYDGTRMSIAYERQHPHTLHQLRMHASLLENRAGNANEYDFAVNYGLGHHWLVAEHPQMQMKAGVKGNFNLGCLYNERNGNNPAQARLSLLTSASLVCKYDLTVLGREIPLELQLAVPVLGLAYSPQYGQSYYEQFELGLYDHNVVLATPLNTPSVDYRLTVGPILKRSGLYVGYEGLIDQSKYNNLRAHSYSHSIIIGVSL